MWQRRIQYACGYLELKMVDDAIQELDAISGDDWGRPEVLSVACDVYSEAKQWRRMIEVAQALASAHPGYAQGWISWAYGRRELGNIAEARDILLKAEELHPSCGNLHYNLACYACLLGDTDEAARRIRLACTIEPGWKVAASDDPDLRDMRDIVAGL